MDPMILALGWIFIIVGVFYMVNDKSDGSIPEDVREFEDDEDKAMRGEY